MSLPQTALDCALWAVLETAPQMPAWDAYGIARAVLQQLAIPEHLPPTFIVREVPEPEVARFADERATGVAELWRDVL